MVSDYNPVLTAHILSNGDGEHHESGEMDISAVLKSSVMSGSIWLETHGSSAIQEQRHLVY